MMQLALVCISNIHCSCLFKALKHSHIFDTQEKLSHHSLPETPRKMNQFISRIFGTSEFYVANLSLDASSGIVLCLNSAGRDIPQQVSNIQNIKKSKTYLLKQTETFPSCIQHHANNTCSTSNNI